MATVDKNQAVIDFLMQCQTIANNPLFFNFLNAKDNSKQVIADSNDIALNKTFIDGSVLKRYTFTIIDFRSVTYLPIAKVPAGTTTTTAPDTRVNENIEELFNVQGIMDWVNEQAEALLKSGTDVDGLKKFNIELRVVRKRKLDDTEIQEGTPEDYEEIKQKINSNDTDK